MSSASWLRRLAPHLRPYRRDFVVCIALSVLGQIPMGLLPLVQKISLDYYDRELGGRIMTRMTTDIEALAQLLQQGLLTAIVSVLSCAGVFVVLFTLDLRLSLAVSAILLLLALGTLLFRRLSAQAYLQARERVSAVNANLQESLAGMRVTQAWRHEAASLRHFTQLSSGYRNARLRSMRLLALYFPYLQALAVAGKALTLGLGASQVAHGQVSAGFLIAFLLYLDQFFTPLQQLSMVFDQWIRAASPAVCASKTCALRMRLEHPKRSGA